MNEKVHEHADNVADVQMLLFFGHDLPTLFRRAADFLENSDEGLQGVQVESDSEDESYRLILLI